jgi:hypothetical protein
VWFWLNPQAIVARHQSPAINVMLRTCPQRSASSEIGHAATPTSSGTTLTSAPSWLSFSTQSRFRAGSTALITLRVMKSDSISANVSANTVQA